MRSSLEGIAIKVHFFPLCEYMCMCVCVCVCVCVSMCVEVWHGGGGVVIDQCRVY